MQGNKTSEYLNKALINYEKNPELKLLFGSKLPKALKDPGTLKQTWARRLAQSPEGLNRWIEAFNQIKDIEGHHSLAISLGENLKDASAVESFLGELFATQFLLNNPIPSLKCRVNNLKIMPRSNPLYDLSFEIKGKTHLASIKTPRSFDPFFYVAMNRIQYEALFNSNFNRHFSIASSLFYGPDHTNYESRLRYVEQLFDDILPQISPKLENKNAHEKVIVESKDGTVFNIGWRKLGIDGDASVGLTRDRSGFIEDKKQLFLDVGPLWPHLLSITYQEFLKFYIQFEGKTEDKHLIYVSDLDTLPLFYDKQLTDTINNITAVLGIDEFFKTEIIIR